MTYNNIKLSLCLTVMLLLCGTASAQAPSPLHVEGRFLVDADGRRHNLHGFCQTYSPWFNERGTKWTNYNVSSCLAYNKGIIDGVLAAGWQMTFVRQHMDPYWSNTPGQTVTGEDDISAFDMTRFKKYLRDVFIPMAEYAVSKGMYVVMRPPGVCPQDISVGDAYQQYLLKVWEYVSKQTKLKNNQCIMFELANEPVRISHATGDGFKEMHDYFQPIVDKIREQCQNVVLVPGLGWQSQYAGYAQHPITGTNVGYAVHCYPGWYNGGHGDGDVTVNYAGFWGGWQQQIGPVAQMAPVVVTEMDWAPSKYNASWGKSVTGTAGGTGFGANFHKIVDDTQNVSWVVFTDPDLLAQYDDAKPDGKTFLTDPEACPRPCFRWYQHYASQEYQDLINDPAYGTGIREIEDLRLKVDGLTADGVAVYDLQGRKVNLKSQTSNLKSGIYIVGGRKVVVK